MRDRKSNRGDNHSLPLASYSSGARNHTNIYEFVNRIHNILFGAEGSTSLDAVKDALPIIAYVLKKGADDEKAMETTVGKLLEDLRTAQNEIIAYVVATRQRLYKNPELDQFLNDMQSHIASMQITTLRRFLEALKHKEVLRALLREDILGALFEKMAHQAFKGPGGKYLTHRNMVITMREIAWALIEKQNQTTRDYTVYDPCTGSSRFLTFWMDKIKEECGLQGNSIAEYASQHLFGTDKYPDMVGLSGLNMVIHGNGVTNIFRGDATDHFGFLADFGAVATFLKSFKNEWPATKQKLLGTTFTREVQDVVAPQEDKVFSFSEDIMKRLSEGKITIDMNSQEVEALYQVVYSLAKNNIALKGLPGLNRLAERASLPAIHFLSKYIWSRQNRQIKKGFDLLLTNPPMGRVGKGKGGRGELQIADKVILSQYSLATKTWIPTASSEILKAVAERRGISSKGDDLKERLASSLGREWIDVSDLKEHRFEIVFKDDELGWEYPILYKSNWEPIVFQKTLPIQVLLLEQFLRVARRDGGLVFSVIDVGVLNNPGDEYVRQLLFRKMARIRAIVELPQGAFRYCGAGSKTGLILFERMKEVPEDYEFFVADVKQMGYDIRSEEAAPQAENDLPKAICEWKRALGLPLPSEHSDCGWKNKKTCSWWTKQFEMVQD